MYIPRALFSRLFLKVFFVLSLYIVGRLVTLPHEISFESLSLQIKRPRAKYGWRTYTHTVNLIMHC